MELGKVRATLLNEICFTCIKNTIQMQFIRFLNILKQCPGWGEHPGAVQLTPTCTMCTTGSDSTGDSLETERLVGGRGWSHSWRIREGGRGGHCLLLLILSLLLPHSLTDRGMFRFKSILYLRRNTESRFDLMQYKAIQSSNEKYLLSLFTFLHYLINIYQLGS